MPVLTPRSGGNAVELEIGCTASIEKEEQIHPAEFQQQLTFIEKSKLFFARAQIALPVISTEGRNL
jgi:hypothetical protein